jgi:ribonuclease P protein component
VAFAIGRAIGPAVVRNQIRRRLRVLLVETALPPGSYLIGARPAIAGRSFAELRRDVISLRSSIALTVEDRTSTR